MIFFEEVHMAKAQYAILRFSKYKGPEIGRIEAHDERTKEKSGISSLTTNAPRRNTPAIQTWIRAGVRSTST